MFLWGCEIMKKLITLCISLCILGMLLIAACDLGPSPGAYLSVSEARCKGCRQCVEVCNADAIVIISNKAVIDPSKCIQCKKCIDICPEDAIQ